MDSIMTGLLRLPFAHPLTDRSIQSILPFLSENDQQSLSPLSRVNKAVDWSIAGFSVLLGCDIVVMDDRSAILPSDYSSVKVLAPGELWPTRTASREAWLESSLLQMNQVAWVNRDKGSVALTSTRDLSVEADVEQMLYDLERVLQFLQTECTKQGSTYCLVRGSDSSCLLYDISHLPQECDVVQVSPELALPIARVCYSLSVTDPKKANKESLLAKAWRMLGQLDMDSDPELTCLVAMDYSVYQTVAVERVETLLIALSGSTDWDTGTIQKLLVSIVTVICRDVCESPKVSPLVALGWMALARALLKRVREDRREVECRFLQKDMPVCVARSLIQLDLHVDDVHPVEALMRSSSQTLGSIIKRIVEDLKVEYQVPPRRFDRMQLALDYIDGLGAHEWEGTAHTEIGSELIMQVVKGETADAREGCLLAMSHLVKSLQAFTVMKEEKRKLLMTAAFMNLSRVFKLVSSQPSSSDSLTVYQVINRIRAISCVCVASKLTRSVSLSIAGTELYQLGVELIGVPNLLPSESDTSVESYADAVQSIVDTHSLSGSIQVKKITGLKFGGVGEFALAGADVLPDIHDVTATAQSCFDLALLYTAESDRSHMRAMVDNQIARRIAESNGDGKDALRHVNKAVAYFEANADDEWISTCTCLKATILFKLGETQSAIRCLVAKLTEDMHGGDIRKCLQSICMQELNSKNPVKNARVLLEAVVRGTDVAFIKNLVV